MGSLQKIKARGAMNVRIALVCALACMFAAVARAEAGPSPEPTFPIIIASGTGAAATTATISSGAVLLGALGLAVGTGTLLGLAARRHRTRWYHSPRRSYHHYGPRKSYRYYRHKREAVPTSEEMQLFHQYLLNGNEYYL